ncbi:MAG: hypothetical protein A3C46_01450 [Deltaproteobacteria bacterium RIFCSPHIGHO2_02_FULL_44_16]|nr:MAG: hypothetical protein A3C46_01450 [Deltaproteobacteria bacterium RIFCSPHIGHO2_02_FULL_44_16]
MKTSDKLTFGAKQAVENCVCVKPGERVLVVTDLETKTVADAIVAALKKITEEVQVFMMEDFGKRDLTGKNPLPFPKELEDLFANWATTSFYIGQSKPGELKSFRRPLYQCVGKYRVKHAHMISINEEIMSIGMAVDYKEVQRVTKLVNDIVRTAKKIHVTSPAGSDFVAEFDPKLKWLICDGIITQDHWSNLPGGETYTAPKTVNGHVVFDGVLGDFFSEKYRLIEKTPLSFDLRDGRIVEGSLQCENEKLRQEYEAYIHTDANANRVGEFAIGTNVGLSKLIGNLLQDEKFPGVHIALGNPYPDMTGADWKSDVHCDGVMQKTTVIVDGRTIMKEGKFIL